MPYISYILLKISYTYMHTMQTMQSCTNAPVTLDPRTIAPVNSAKNARTMACLCVIVLAATAVENEFATSFAPVATSRQPHASCKRHTYHERGYRARIC